MCVISSANEWRKFENRRSTAASEALEPSPAQKASAEGNTAIDAAPGSGADASVPAWCGSDEGDGAGPSASAGGGVIPNSLSSAGEMSEACCDASASRFECCGIALASCVCCDGGVGTFCPTLASKRSNSGEVSGDDAVDWGGEGMPAGTAGAAAASVGESSAAHL